MKKSHALACGKATFLDKQNKYNYAREKKTNIKENASGIEMYKYICLNLCYKYDFIQFFFFSLYRYFNMLSIGFSEFSYRGVMKTGRKQFWLFYYCANIDSSCHAIAFQEMKSKTWMPGQLRCECWKILILVVQSPFTEYVMYYFYWWQGNGMVRPKINK